MKPLDLHGLLFGHVAVFGFVAALFALSKILPGREALGVALEDGSRIRYRLNGLWIFLLVVAVALGGQAAGLFSLSALVRNFWGLVVAANVFAFGATFWLFFRGRARRGTSSRAFWLADLYYGVELNPSLFGVDLKLFSYRPSLIGLWLVNASFAVWQLEERGSISTAMWLYQAFTSIYVFNYFQFEHGMLFTWDIVSERFGWMLVWGDYAFVPFCYSIVGAYIPDRTEPLSTPAAIALALLFVVGLWMFRGANQQKDAFKRDPSVKIWGKPAETLGGRILVSGFWGIGRKLNYTGEILVYLAFTMLVGTTSIVPYLLPAWLIGLLMHRAHRDDKRCREKYGALWDEYCRRARFKMFPFVY